jgi:glycosyltransferase involved in cell wall biosynthesis
MKKQKILWIPHAPWESLDGQREFHLIRALRDRHDIHVVTWNYNRGQGRAGLLSPAYLAGVARRSTREVNGITLHHIPSLPHLLNLFAADKSYPLRANERIFRASLRTLHAAHRFDIVICGTIQWMFGDLPELQGARVFFDYLDAFHDWQLDRIARYAPAATCVSHYLQRQIDPFCPETLYSPNGVNVERFAAAEGSGVRKRYQLEGRLVVSLIGLTCSERFYFVDALADLQRRRSEIFFLMVGGGAARLPLERACRRAGLEFLSVGPVPNTEVAEYFAATDVGLYPGERSAVYDGACPIKVLEYTAARKPVVSSFTWELAHLGFANVLLAEPQRDIFGAAVERALDYAGAFPDMSRYSWVRISEEFENFVCG